MLEGVLFEAGLASLNRTLKSFDIFQISFEELFMICFTLDTIPISPLVLVSPHLHSHQSA